jgi:hypothetical protein
MCHAACSHVPGILPARLAAAANYRVQHACQLHLAYPYHWNPQPSTISNSVGSNNHTITDSDGPNFAKFRITQDEY